MRYKLDYHLFYQFFRVYHLKLCTFFLVPRHQEPHMGHQTAALKVFCDILAFKFPHFNLLELQRDVLDKRIQSMVAPPHIIQDLKDLLFKSWCWISQHAFRGPELNGAELFWQHKDGPTQYLAAGFNVMADHWLSSYTCISKLFIILLD